MKTIEIVTHCWSGPKVPIYHRLLQLQLSTIVKHVPDGMHIIVTVFYTPYDVRTVEVLSWFTDLLDFDQNVSIQAIPLDESLLFRRAIGRNIAATTSKADVLWFTDCDYCFWDGALLSAHKQCLDSECNMVFPRIVNIHKSHSYGDVLVDKLGQIPLHLASIDPDHFEPRKERKAIGGIQIVKGDWCRQFGYLSETKWVRAVDPSDGFRSCKCDVPFRQSVGRSEPVDIPGVYRIRHSRAGRDGGTKDHGDKTRAK